MTSTFDAASVKSFAPFEALTSEEASAVARLLEVQSLPKGEVLFREGDASDTIYMIASGEMDISIKVPNHDDHHLVTFGSGAIFGEVAPLAGERRSATVKALTDVTLARLPWATLESALKSGETWASKFLLGTAKTLARRLRIVDSQLASMLAQIDACAPERMIKTEDELDRLRTRLLQEWSF